MRIEWPRRQSSRIHRARFRVYIEDTDAGRIMYYANHLKYAERGRTEMLRAAGVSHARMMADDGLMLTVRRCVVDFLRPALLDDEIAVETALESMAGATLALNQRLCRDGDELSRLDIVIACVGRDGKARRLPEHLRRAIQEFDQTNEMDA